MSGSGSGPAPPWTPLRGRIARLAADPAMGLHRRSEAVYPASGHAIFGSGATTSTACARVGGAR